MSKHTAKRIAGFAAFYLLAYCLASYLDLATTALAVAVPGVHVFRGRFLIMATSR